MNNNSQTLKFVVAAAVMAGLAGLTSALTRPTPIDDFANVGEPFFADFKDPNSATSVRVVAYNEDTASARVFTVENKNGVWRIPSHHNYPADGEEQLAKTARTLIGVKRGAVASRVAADHERFGVVDPLEDGTDTLKGRGQRLTLFKESDIAVADLIIGKKLPEAENRYYVRYPGEKETYITELEVDISTKFRDWVEADLLKLDRDDLTQLQARSTKVEGRDFSEVVDATLVRQKFSDPWVLDGINEETEEVNKDGVTEMVNVLDNLKLSGVRRKPELAGRPILQGDLGIALPPSAAQNPQIVNQVIDMVQSSLNSKGFLVYENREENDFRLYAKAGELVASLKDGVQFHMSFGNEFEGSDDEIEIGGSTATSDTEDGDGEQKPSDPPGADAEGEDGKNEDTEDDEKKTKSRYLIVRASFSEDLLGPAPVEPVKPNIPDGVEVDEEGNVVKPAEDAATESDDAGENNDATSEEKADDSTEPADGADDAETKDAAADDKNPADAATEEKAEEKKEETPDLGAIYQRAIEKYRSDLKKYESDVEAREQEVEEGEKKVDELNDRFADWYYVITEEDFDKLRLSREQLVKAKEKEEPADGDAAPATPGEKPAAPAANPAPAAKPASPADESKTPADNAAKPADANGEEPAPAKPADSEAKPADEKSEPAKPAPAKPADDSKPAEPKPATPEEPTKEAASSPAKPADEADAQPAAKPEPPAEKKPAASSN